MDELAKRENVIPALSVGPFVVTRTGLQLARDPTWEEWQAFFDGMQHIEDAVQWNIGDALVHVEIQYGESATQLTANYPEYKYGRLLNYRWVARNVEYSTRVETLEWTHHREVASLDIKQQKIWLRRAEKNGWNHRELKRQMRISKLSSIEGDGKVKIIKGDLINVLPKIKQEFNLVIADPPYNVTGWHWDHIDDYLNTAMEWIKSIKATFNNKHHLFWFCSPKYVADFELIFRELDLPIKSRIVWHRRNMSMGSAARSKFIDSWEMIFHSGNHDLNFPDRWGEDWFDVQIHAVPQSNFQDMKIHPTQKPLALIRRLVRFGSFEGDKVLDPFAGSGTTGHACIVEGRDCVLVERDPEYIQVIRKRLNANRS